MTGDYEDLSRLLDGDLEPAEAEALRARIAAEPALAAAWARMRALPVELADLPDEMPPPALDERVLGRPSGLRGARAGTSLQAPSPSLRPLWMVPAALAAIVILWVGLRPSPLAERVVLVDGEQWVEGRADVIAGALPIHVDGLARIVVEPPPGVARGSGSEEATMKAVLAGATGALAGAAVTVAVVRGEATLVPATGDPIVVVAGDSRTIAPGGAAHAAPRRELPDGATSAQRIQFLEAEVADLRERLAEAEFTSTVARGQLLAEQGEPLPWPSAYPDALRPERFEAVLREKAAASGLEVHAIDCTEFPCIATLRVTDLSEGWKDRVHALPEALSPQSQSETGVWMLVSASDDGEEASGTVGVALVPEGADDVNQRTDWRAKALIEDVHPPGP